MEKTVILDGADYLEERKSTSKRIHMTRRTKKYFRVFFLGKMG